MLKMKISWNSILTHGVGNPHTYFQFYNILKSRSRAGQEHVRNFFRIYCFTYISSVINVQKLRNSLHTCICYIFKTTVYKMIFHWAYQTKILLWSINWKTNSKFYKSSCYNTNASWYLIHLRIWALELENYNILMLSYKRGGYQNRNHTGNIVAKLSKPPLQKYMCALLLLRNNSFLY